MELNNIYFFHHYHQNLSSRQEQAKINDRSIYKRDLKMEIQLKKIIAYTKKKKNCSQKYSEIMIT